jgi:putative SOS response-associated peptidase YedK
MLAPVHNRMPVMLSDINALDWLKGDEIEHALSLLKPCPADLMDGYEVSKLVNSPFNDTPACIAPV